MKRTLIAATIAGTALVTAGAYAGGNKAQHGQNESAPSASSQSSIEQQTPQGSQDSGTVKSVQEALAAQGYDPGPVDGKLGSRTKSALKQAQKDKGVSESGQIDQQTLAALGVGETGSSGASSGTGSGASSSSGMSSGSTSGSSESTSSPGASGSTGGN